MGPGHRRRMLWACLGASLLLFAGCGGDNGPSTGSLKVSVVWPVRPVLEAKMIPAGSEAITIRLFRGEAVEPEKTVSLVRPATDVLVEALVPGDLRIEAEAFPQADGTGVVQATGASVVTITAGQTAPLALSLDSAVDHATISPSGPVRFSGKPVAFAVSFLNATGEVVLVAPSAIKWTSTADSVATVTQQGVATATGLGKASIQVQDTESGKSASADVVAVALLAFSRRDSAFVGLTDIFVRASDAPAEVRLTHNSEDYPAIDPAISPDGTRIAFAQFVAHGFQGYQIYLMNIDGSGLHPLTKALEGNEQSPSWSPDGRWIAYGQQGTLMIVRLDGRNRHTLGGAAFANCWSPRWSPDGRKIAFSRGRDTGNATQPLAFVISVCNRDGTGLRDLSTPTLSWDDTWPSWSPDGSQIAFQRLSLPSGKSDIFINDEATIRPVTNVGNVDRTDWAGDNLIYFCRNEADHIWRVAPDGTGQEAVTTETKVYASPSFWTPVPAPHYPHV